jgi:hypothetical protein
MDLGIISCVKDTLILNLMKQINELDIDNWRLRIEKLIEPYSRVWIDKMDRVANVEFNKDTDLYRLQCAKFIGCNHTAIAWTVLLITKHLKCLKRFNDEFKIDPTASELLNIIKIVDYYDKFKFGVNETNTLIKILTIDMMTFNYWKKENYCNDCNIVLKTHCCDWSSLYICSQCGHRICSSCHARYRICFKCTPKEEQDIKRLKNLEAIEQRKREEIQENRIRWENEGNKWEKLYNKRLSKK